MSAVADLEAKIAAGVVVTAAELGEAAAADRLAELKHDIATRQAADKAAADRLERIATVVPEAWARVDAATDRARKHYDKLLGTLADLCAAIDEADEADRAFRAFLATERVQSSELPERNGRGWFDRDALGDKRFTVPTNGGGRADVRWPVSDTFWSWLKAKRAG